MKAGTLVKIVKNDMSLVIKKPGPKDSKFFNQVGTIIRETPYKYRLFRWFEVFFPSGIYETREDAIMVLEENESR